MQYLDITGKILPGSSFLEELKNHLNDLSAATGIYRRMPVRNRLQQLTGYVQWVNARGIVSGGDNNQVDEIDN